MGSLLLFPLVTWPDEVYKKHSMHSWLPRFRLHPEQKINYRIGAVLSTVKRSSFWHFASPKPNYIIWNLKLWLPVQTLDQLGKLRIVRCTIFVTSLVSFPLLSGQGSMSCVPFISWIVQHRKFEYWRFNDHLEINRPIAFNSSYSLRRAPFSVGVA